MAEGIPAQHWSVLLKLSDLIIEMNDPDDLGYGASEILGRALSVSRVGYSAIDPDKETLHTSKDWCAPGVLSFAGMLQLRDYTPFIESLRRGEFIAINDVREDERTAVAAASLESASARSLVNVPVIELGRLRAVMYVNHAKQRIWSKDELLLIQEVARRTRTAMGRLAAEAKIRASEEQLRAERGRLLDLFRQAPVFMTVLSGPEHTFEMTNRLYDELIGNRDAVGKPVREAIPEAVDQGFIGLLDQVYQSGEVFRANGISIDLARTKGEHLERRYIDFVYQPIKKIDGSTTGIIAVGVDVTGRKTTENALQQQQERFSFATTAAGVGYWFCDLPFAELIWDNCVKEHFWLASDTRVTIETFYAVIHPDDRESTRQAIETSIACKTTYDTVYRTVAPDGKLKWIRAIGRTGYGEDGDPIRFDGITIDITHQRQSEEALLRNEKLAVVGRMAASISHEINNPLESVTNLLYLIRTHAEASDSLSGYAEQAEEELARVSQIVTHTLQFNRESTAPQEQNLSTLMESAVAIYSARLTQSGVRLVRDYREQQTVFCMQSEIRQVLSNLIGNAYDASKRGGTLTLRTRDSFNWQTSKKCVRVTIADTGHGMDMKTRSRIFDPFFTTKGLNGTGLGLWVSAEILNRHKASIRVKSRRLEEFGGTVFSLSFPCSPHQ
ncbi:ATP-binding protein [Tunturibacter empetritectus]|uniref:histidine kinase n=1 Tax=Tunturiibacter empetritectus TaxID=3069691 RepID=A0AAU7ZG87_9BACT